jgi:hypothetical protein
MAALFPGSNVKVCSLKLVYSTTNFHTNCVNPYKPTGPKLERYTILCLQNHRLKNELKEGVGQFREGHCIN